MGTIVMPTAACYAYLTEILSPRGEVYKGPFRDQAGMRPRLSRTRLAPRGAALCISEKVRPQILGALLTLLAQDFNAGPTTQLPNRKTKWQKLEESIPYLIGNCGGTWVGTVTELQKVLNFPIHVNPLGRYLKETESLNVTRVKNDKVVTLTLTLAS